MPKSKEGIVILAGAAALLLMGSRKKKSVSGSSGSGDVGAGTDLGTDLPDVNSDGGTSGTGSSGWGGDSSRAKSAGGIWASSDCSRVEYQGGSPDAWWSRHGRAAAQSFINAGYLDAYQISRDILKPILSCAEEFPTIEDEPSSSQRQHLLEGFLKKHRDAYYLIIWVKNQVNILLALAARDPDGPMRKELAEAFVNRDEYNVIFDDDCRPVFVGKEWFDWEGEDMVRYYLDTVSPMGVPEEFDDVDVLSFENAMSSNPANARVQWDQNVALSVINRLHPGCASKISASFASGELGKNRYLSSRPDLNKMWNDLISEIHRLDDERFANEEPWFNPNS